MASPVPVDLNMEEIDVAVSSGVKRRGRGIQCVVYGCNNYQYNSDGSLSNFHFSKFPQANPRKSLFCKLIKRAEGKDEFKVTSFTKICSAHFKADDISGGMCRKKLKDDAIPKIFTWTPELKLRPAPHQRLFKQPIPEEATKQKGKTCVSIGVQTDFSSFNSSLSHHSQEMSSSEHSYAKNLPSAEHNVLEISINQLQKEITSLKFSNANLESKLKEMESLVATLKKRIFSVENMLVGNDDAVRFYTGFQNYDSFEAVFKYLEPKMESAHYWRGPESKDKANLKYQQEGYQRSGPKRKLKLIDEFFMVMVRCKVGLFEDDLADRFDIAVSQVSKIFTTHINLVRRALQQLFPMPTQAEVRLNIPKNLRNTPLQG